MRLQSTAWARARETSADARSSVAPAPGRRFLTWGHAVGAGAVVLLLLAGCGDGGDGRRVPADDFLVSFPSPLEIFIRRPFDRPFRVLEVGVTPFVTPGIGSEPYVLSVSGIALSDGAEIVFEAPDSIQRAFSDPLGERVIDVLIICDCFVDFVILGAPFGETIFTFE